MRDLFIVGAGGFGREAVWTVERINALSGGMPQWRILGYADDDPKWKKGDNFEGYPILGSVLAIGSNTKREAVYGRLRGHDFPVIIDPKAQISPTTDFRHGGYIAAGAVVQVGATLGKFVIVGANAVVSHDAVIADFVNMGPGTVIASGVKVGKGCAFYANSATMPWITVGEGAKVTCGAVVKADVPAGTTV